MTNQHSNHNELLAEDGLAVSFGDDRNAYNALTVLKELDSQRRVGVHEAVVVVRGEDGRVVERTGSSRSSSPTPPPALGAISSTVQVGRTSLLAVVTEQSHEVIDAAMANLGGTVLRRPVADVEAEIAAVEDAERKAKWEARKELARSHREHDKDAVDAKLYALEAKLSRGQKTPA